LQLSLFPGYKTWLAPAVRVSRAVGNALGRASRWEFGAGLLRSHRGHEYVHPSLDFAAGGGRIAASAELHVRSPDAPSDSARSSGVTLLQRFTVVSLFTIIAVGIVFGAAAVHLMEEYALSQHAHSAAVYVSEFLAPRLVPKDFLSPPPARRIQFVFAIRGVTGKAGILRVSVWNARGQVLYSDASATVGRAFPLSAPLRAALSGRTDSRILSLSQGQQTRRVMEVFVPVVLRGTGHPVAVYDILSDLMDLDSTLGRLRRSVWAGVVSCILVLYVALFTIVRRASRQLERQHEALRTAFAGAVQSLVNAVSARDAATANHSDQVADLAVAIAEAARLNEADVRNVRIAAFLHDVGKIGIHDSILDKHGPLTREERAAMQRHAALGYEILLPVPIPDAIKRAVRHHHERWDGSGYPDGLAGEAIPVAARVIAVADAYGALTSDRPYRSAQDPGEAMAEIERCAGTQFDPKIVAAFQRVWQAQAKPAVLPPTQALIRGTT
jgi:putative nucleotidyltransferase with HDIG domain